METWAEIGREGEWAAGFWRGGPHVVLHIKREIGWVEGQFGMGLRIKKWAAGFELGWIEIEGGWA